MHRGRGQEGAERRGGDRDGREFLPGRGGEVHMGSHGGRFLDRSRGFAPGYGGSRGSSRHGHSSGYGGQDFSVHRGNYGQIGGRGGRQEQARKDTHSARMGWIERGKKQEDDAGQGKDERMEDADEREEVEGDDPKISTRCSRCTKKGHAATKCTAEIYCVICDGHDHVNHRCPVLKMPRPVAHAAGYAVHGLGFYHIPRPALPRARIESKTALISVKGGVLTKEQVLLQMQRLFPGKWKWELIEHEENGFITKFPSKSELQRSITFGGADVREPGVPQGVRLKFDLWHEREEGYLLPMVWIKVYGIRKALREFLELWAVGSMLGSTQTVDIETTRRSEFGRIFVAVLNPKLIPSHMDVVIGDHYFELQFEVERIGVDENGEEVEVEWSGEAGGNGGKEGGMEGLMEEEEDVFRGHKRQKGNEHEKENNGKGIIEKGTEGSPVSHSSLKELVQDMSEEEFMAFLRKKAEAILDTTVERVLDVLSRKVMAEKSEDSLEAEAMDLGINQTFDSVKAKAAAAIPEAINAVVRSSPRLTGSTDEHAMDKAQRRASEKALENLEGTLSPKSVATSPDPFPVSFSACDSLNLIEQVGIKYGSYKEELERVVQQIFVLDNNKPSYDLEGNGESDYESDFEEDSIEKLEQRAVKSLCEDLLEEVYDDDNYHLSSDVRVVGKNYKSGAKSLKRKTCKVRVSKNSENVSK